MPASGGGGGAGPGGGGGGGGPGYVESLGRISGPLLAANLRRNEDLAFKDTELSDPVLFLNIGARQIGINTDSTNNALTVLGKTLTTDLVVDTHAETPNFYISTNRIQNLVDKIYLQPNQATDPKITAVKFGTLNLRISDLLIENITNNSDITLEANTGQVVFNTSKVNVDGDLHATGDITFDGDVTFGTDNTDNVTFSADIASSIVPDDNITWDLGSTLKRWANAYITDLHVDNITISGLNVATLEANGTTQVAGNAFLGSDSSDVITLTSKIDNNLIPTAGTYTLGNNTTPKIWKTLFLTGLDVDGKIDVRSNTITTLATNEALELIASGTGRVYIQYTDVNITQDLNVDGNSTLGNVSITGLLDLPGAYTWTQTGNSVRNGVTLVAGFDVITGFYGQSGVILTGPNSKTITVNVSVIGVITIVSVDSGALSGTYVSTGGTRWLYSQTGNTNITGTLTLKSPNITQFQDISVTNNIITTTVTDNDLRLVPDGTGQVHVVTTNVQITNDLDVGLYGYFGSLTVGTGITVPEFTVGDIFISNNDITTISTNRDLVLQANGSGIVHLMDSDVAIPNNLTSGSLNVNGATSLQDVVIRSEVITPTTTQVSQNISGTSTPTGFFFYGWADDPGQSNPPFGVIQVGWTCVQIPGSVVTVVGDGVTNYDITITGGSFASGGFYSFTGDVVTYSPATVTQTGNINQTGSTYIEGTFANNNVTILNPSYLTVPNFKFENNVIQVTAPATDLVINSLGGGVVFNRILKIADNIIGNIFDVNDIELAFNNLYLTEDNQLLLTEDGDNYLLDTNSAGDLSVRFRPSGTGKMRINSTKALAVAYGNNTNRVLGDVGEIRQNSTTGLYEGYSPNGLVSFNNIYDNDRNTYITPELTPGANDNILRFGINGSVRATISSTILFSNNLNVDNVSITGTTISNLISANDLELSPVGTGYVSINDILFTSNTVAPLSDDPLILESTGTGYFKFTGSGGLVIPVGNSSTERPLVPELGEVRYNSTGNYTEVFNGSAWVSASGASSAATEEDIAAETNLWAFVLG